MFSEGEWIYAIKLAQSKTADEAMQQIEHKDYVMKYRKTGKKIMLLCVNFDFHTGNITDWIKEEFYS